ncbi:MAG: ABC transporter permease [Treponema sp.]|nr:ABC transporter permease [Treponema sp.]
MKARASFFIAIRYLWGRAREGVRYLRGAAAGIAVSLVPIIVTLIVADGMIRGITDRYMELGTGHLQVVDYNDYGGEDETIKYISGLDGVRGIWKEQHGMGMIAGKSGKTGVTVRAIEPSFWDEKGSLSFLKIIDGTNKPETDRDIVLGETLAQNLGVRAGDTVRLMTVIPTQDGRMSPRTASFTVRGILSCGYNELDALWCITNYEGAKRVFSSEQSSSTYIIKIDDPYKKADDFVMELHVKLPASYSIFTWKDLLRSQYSSYQTTRQLLLFIMALIVIVAAVNVSSATSMLALERQRDIAVLKVAGSGVRGITDIFLWGSFLTGLIGGLIGIIAGLLIGSHINEILKLLEKIINIFTGLFNGNEVKILDPGFYLETIPIIIDWNAVLIIWLFTILCSVTASLIPAVKAGKLKPMELLRKT